ncbi:uncharacterized protein LOC129374465 isoform X2 [Poeciliopsis prolifica]|uniref:uncharacterized protein LOC129374465 isoform X2 n=1 Tax=Poeciliopsis prolifica TaxID=188132 RepID=UPI0024133C14|nr:uncharacterized protein LOC129374465 isoform X2 [Poeciliopsis prolifica]
MERGRGRKAAVHPTDMNFSYQREYSKPTPESDAESGYSSLSFRSSKSKDLEVDFRSDRPSAAERLSEESDSSKSELSNLFKSNRFMRHKENSWNLPGDRLVRESPLGSECSSSEFSDVTVGSNRSKDADHDFKSHPECFRNTYEKLIQSQKEVISQKEVLRQKEDLLRQREDLIRQQEAIRQREDLIRQQEAIRQREDLIRQQEAIRQLEDLIRQQSVQNQEAQRKINAVGDEQHLNCGTTHSCELKRSKLKEQQSEIEDLQRRLNYEEMQHQNTRSALKEKDVEIQDLQERLRAIYAELQAQVSLQFSQSLSADCTALHQRTMSDNKRSVVILGNGKSLKEALITNFLGKDLSSLTKGEINGSTVYETNELKFICTPDFETSHSKIKALFSKKQLYDMYLVVVEKGFSLEGTWKLIVDLSNMTGVGTENLFVVLPLQHKQVPESQYAFKFYTFNQLQSKLSELEKKSTASSSLPTEGNKGRHPDTKVNLVLLGMTGTGKSASGNTIIGKKVFESRISSIPITKECQKEEVQINSLNVRVIDTPDMFDDEMAKSAKDKHVKKCKELCGSDPCVYLLVMHVSRFTDGEREILKKLEKMFGGNVSKQTVLLFTRGNDLKQSDMSFRDFLHDCQEKLKKIAAKCDNRCVLFENSTSDPDQVDKLMKMVDLVLK